MPTINLILPPDDDLDDCGDIDTDNYARMVEAFVHVRALPLEDIESIAFEVGARWDDLPGSTSRVKAMALARWCAVGGHLDKIEAILKRDYGLSV